MKRSILSTAFVCFCTLAFAATCVMPQAFAATIDVADLPEDGPLCPRLNNAKLCFMLNMEGTLVAGDADELRRRIENVAKISGVPSRIGLIYLDSTGGDMYEAMKIGELLRKHKIQAAIRLKEKCYSACVLVLAGGVARFPFGQVGVHSFYSKAMTKAGFDYEKEDAQYRAVAEDVNKYLVKMRVPTALLDEMIKTPPTTIKMLEPKDTQRLGLVGVDPLFHQLLVTKGYLKGT